MHSYTHGGVYQVARRIGPTHIGPQYEPDEVEDLLQFADSVLSAVAIEAVSLFSNLSLEEKVHELIFERFPRRA